MGKRNLLFVLYPNERLNGVFTYAVDLAKTRGEDLTVLFLDRDERGAVTGRGTPAEGDTPELSTLNMDMVPYREYVKELVKECGDHGIRLYMFTTAVDALSAVRHILGQRSDISMVLLSPKVTMSEDVSGRKMNSIAKETSTPIVGMTRRPLFARSYDSGQYSYPTSL